jgi:aryl-alcohol dehydrogenase-like predicted oxidoreductase
MDCEGADVENTVIETVIGQGGVAGVAMLALWLLNRTWADALHREARNAEQIRQDRQALNEVLTQNVHAMTRMETLLTALVEQLNKRHVHD